MSLLKNITDEMYLSMKSGDKEKANALRTLISKLKDQQIKLRKDISDEETLKIIKTLVKQRRESAEIYSKAGREELAEKENFEISILDNYLPKLMSDEDVLSLIKKIVDETNAKDLSDIGKVMPLVMQRGKGKVDGKIANRILRSLLE
ncbi:MAG: glutamyl-tRNA amidotransferase [Candidatus Marinimicrobia bacterium]|nr:glutamyl-tRNA amidotransferase [Candidatus Neomarinimicrobiota bacterium]|tara:strand:- start:29 stop:472 length:444 start_codon:yes stop_codon:yes gene_type:complete